MDLEKLLRNNIRNFKPYSSARDEYSGKEGIFLDANENAFGSVSKVLSNRYPDPHQSDLKKKLSELKQIPESQIFLGNGSDEAIDLLFRAFCRPGIDNVIIMPPTYGMYEVCADLNDIRVHWVPLTVEFEIDVDRVMGEVSENTKLIILCSPNNPSANLMNRSSVYKLLDKFEGLIVLDEAYIDFSEDPGFLGELNQYENLVILQTFSKAWGMAGLRLGMAFAHPEIIQVLNNIKYPYNISLLTQIAVSEALDNIDKKHQYVKVVLEQRKILTEGLGGLKMVQKIYPSESNFILVRFENAKDIYSRLLEEGIIVRDRSGVMHCENCLRITVGTAEENQLLLNILNKIDLG